MDRELLIAARAGDEVAFSRLLEVEAPRIYRAVLAVVRTPEDAQDVVQEASVRAWRQLRDLREPDRWAAWYRRIAVRQALDRAGRLARERVREVVLDGQDMAHDPTAAWTERAAVDAALKKLTSDERLLLGLRYGSDLEIPDIAAALESPLGTAKSRLHRALARLAEAMGERDVR